MITEGFKDKADVKDDTQGSVESVADKLNGDDALLAVGPGDAAVEIDEATNRRLLRKIDWNIMPILCVVYGLNYLDKTTLSYASITGFQEDIHLSGDNYQWLGSAFHIGFISFEFFAVRLLQYLPLAKYSAFCVVAWGIVLVCFAAVQNFAGAVAIRVLLGVFEASVNPAWALFTSQWYRIEEQGFRLAVWLSFNGWAQIFGGLVAYGFAHGRELHHYSIAAWKAIYILMGLITVIVGIVFVFVIPDNQLNAKWLTAEERVLAVERIRNNQQGIGNRHFKMYQLWEAFSDPAVWATYLFALVTTIPYGGLTSFFSLLIKSFGYTSEQSLLYGCISGVIQICSLMIWAYITSRYGYRLLIGVSGMLIAVVGSIILVALPNSAYHGRLAGFFLAQFYITGVAGIYTNFVSNIAGYTKKTTAAGGFFVFFSAGNCIGPQTFRPRDAPYYRPAEITLIVCFGIAALDLLFLHFWYNHQNKKKQRAVQATVGAQSSGSRAFLDLTDRENPDFVYAL